MPIYQYQCTDCQHQLEALQKISDPKLVDCPACGQASLRKQVTAAAFKLKGTGWYETDFKNSGNKPSSTEQPSGNNEKGSSDQSNSASNNTSPQKETVGAD